MGHTRGFTLVEILVVVAIIVLLATLLLPVYEAAVKQAEGAVCLTNLKNLVTATYLYADDYDGFCVPARVSWPPQTLGTCWEVLLQPYMRSSLILICPSDPLPSTTTGSVSLKHSYGINYDVALVGGYNGAALMMSAVTYPAQTILLFDLRGSFRTMGTSVRLQGLSRVEARHHGAAHFAFVAGNVKRYRPDRTLQDRGVFGGGSMWDP